MQLKQVLPRLKKALGIQQPETGANRSFTDKKGSLNLERMEAAERRDIDMPLIWSTDNTNAAHASKIVDKLGMYGNRFKNQVANASEQLMASHKDLINKIGPERDQDKIKALYQKAREAIKSYEELEVEHHLKSRVAPKKTSAIGKRTESPKQQPR